MRAPIRFAHRNLVFGQSERDAWAVYRLAMESYEGLTDAQKVELLSAVAGFCYSIGADFSLLRVSRAWSVDDYVARAAIDIDPRTGDAGRWGDYLGRQRRRLDSRGIVRPELYVSVRLTPARASVLDDLLSGSWARNLLPLRRRDPRALSAARLRELEEAEARIFGRVADFFDCERATTLDLQWLVRRAFCRGLGEPDVDRNWRPQALTLLDGTFEPLEADVLRLFDSPIEVHERRLEVHSERGTSHQALLALGALPESVAFPGATAELLFAPLETVGFPVDACLSARFVPNDQATALVARRVVDADNIVDEESRGNHGPSSDAARRPHAARVLEDYLKGEGRPPLLRATIGLVVGASSAEELERRIERLQSEYATVRLHRPGGEQVRLFCEHFPGQATQVRDYADYLLIEQVGALMPVATHAVGSASGAYLGHTLTGSRQPVLLDLREASRRSRPPSVLLCGTLGSGKTLTLQKLLYESFLQGARIVDVDPKGDHALERLPGVGEELEAIELRADARYRGLLDPLRIAPAGTEEDFATSFLIDVLPHPVPPAWRTEVRRAVKAVVAGPRSADAGCGAVIAALLAGDETAREVGRALEVYADTGLAQLGFADDGVRPAEIGSRRVTSLRIRNLPLPLPGTARADLSEEERIGQAVLRLVAGYAMHLTGRDRTVPKLLGFDEAWLLLGDAAGKRLIEHLTRWGRSENATVLLVTHLIPDAESLDNLLGLRLVFGMESEPEAEAALRLLRLDPGSERLRRRLLSYRRGRCMMRDLDGRVGAIQVDVDDELLAALDTTPPEE